MVQRRTVSGPYNDFLKEIRRLEVLDLENQKRLSPNAGKPSTGSITKQQLYLLSEGVFFAAFRAYENFLEDIFLLYAMEKPSLGGVHPKSYLNPKDFIHCRDILKATNTYIDWTDPEQIIKRAELYLKDGEPIKPVMTSHKSFLQETKKLRNHVAHASAESLKQYEKVLRQRLTTVPIKVPKVGEYLNQRSRQNTADHHLRIYLEGLKKIASELAN